MKAKAYQTKLLAVAMLVLFALVSIAGTASAEDDTIADIAAADGRFTTLLAAAQVAGIDGLLDSPGSLTVFAPTDDAFGALPEGTIDALLADPVTLKQILLYHTLQSAVPSDVAITVDTACTGLGKNIGLQVVDGALILNGGAQVIITDIMASNGIIHVIDAVLLPPDGPFDCSGPIGTTSMGVGGGDAGDGGSAPAGDFPLGEPRVPLEIDGDDGKELVGLRPQLIPFEGSFFTAVSIVVTEEAKLGRGYLSGLNGGATGECEAFEVSYLTVIGAPMFTNVPAEYAEMNAVYEAGIQKIGDGARDFFLYCFNGGAFSDLSYFLATSNYDEAIGILERAEAAAIAAFGAPDAPPPPPPPAEAPAEDEEPAEEAPAEEPAAPAEETPAAPAGGENRPEELQDAFPGAELYFSNAYPLGDARLSLFLNNDAGATEEVTLLPNLVPFNGEDFTTVAFMTTVFIDTARTEILPGMSGGNSADCDAFFGAYLVAWVSPRFSGVPEQYQPWVNQYNDGVQQFLNGAKDIAQWCFNGGAFPSNAYQPAVDGATNATNTLIPIVDAALNEFGVPPVIQEAFGFAGASLPTISLRSLGSARVVTFSLPAVVSNIH